MGTGIAIRETKETDIDAISRLYGDVGIADELKWALLFPLDNGGTQRSFVAVTGDGKIVGTATGAISRYAYRGSEITGVHPIFWIVDPEYRGKGIGVELMEKALSLGDFSFIIGGAEPSHALYPKFGLRFKFDINTYCRILDPIRYCRIPGGSLPKKIVKTLCLLAGSARKRMQGTYKHSVELEPYKDSAIIQDQALDDTFFNKQNSRYVKWLLSCPVLDASAFIIKRDNKAVGIAVCYINDRGPIPTGRLVHVSHLGNDIELWNAVLSEIEMFFKKSGCVIISTLASHPAYIKALERAGYISTNRKGRSFFLSDAKNIFDRISNDSWHLTFFEGDMAYRGV